MPLISKFLCYLEAAARMELAGISRLHQIPVSNGYRCVSNGYRASLHLQYPMDTGMSPIDTSTERELLTHCEDPLRDPFVIIPLILLLSSKPKPSAAVAIS